MDWKAIGVGLLLGVIGTRILKMGCGCSGGGAGVSFGFQAGARLPARPPEAAGRAVGGDGY